jgi:tetratricopeptide (TPR) repeat protein
MRAIKAISYELLAISLAAASLMAQTTDDGVAAFRRGHYAEARAILEKAPASDATARTFLALARSATGGCDAARADLSDQFAHNPDATQRRLAGIGLVQCGIAQNRMGEVWPALDQLQKAYPGDADVLYEVAKAHRKGWDDAVFQLYQKAPGSFRVNQLSGEIFETEGRYAEAAAEYRKAIQKNPAALNLHFRLGRALLLESHDAANLKEARKEFEAELALNPSDAVAEFEVGKVLQAEQNATAAIPHFEKAAALDPNFAEPLLELAKTKPGEAIPLLERAVKLQPDNQSAHYALMMAYRNAGRTADALREKAIFDKLNRPPEGEFTDFLKKLGEKPKQ